MPTTETITITTRDGGSMPAHVSRPDGGSGPGILVLQEIFGVNTYIRDVCDRLAREGYTAVAPQLFWRIEPGFEANGGDQAALQAGMAIAGKFDAANGVADLGAAIDAVRALPGSGGRCGIIGFCFGGTFSYLAAVHHQPDAVVSYYGSGVAANIGEVAKVSCPIVFHFGDNDPFLPNADVDKIREATQGMGNVQVVVQAGGGHAFDNSFSPMFSQPAQASAAWSVTSPFLAKHLKG